MLLAVTLSLVLLAPAYDEVDFGTKPADRVKLLRHRNAAVRRRAALLLAHAPPDEAIVALVIALQDPDAGVRAAAASSLNSLGDERAAPFLARRLREEVSTTVLPELLLGLARCGEAHVARFAVPFLEHRSRRVRAAAATALGRIGDAGQRDPLWAAFRYAPDDPGFVVRAAVLSAFAQLGWRADVEKAIAEIEAMGAHRHWVSRAAVFAAIGMARLRSRADWVRGEIVKEPDPRVVAVAAAALMQLGFADDVVALCGHESPAVRRAALVALQDFGDARAVPRALAMVRDDADPAVRFEAALVLHEARHPDAPLYLVDALRSSNPLFWISALTALESRYDRSFGRDPDAWTEFLKQRG